jgi:hypothetical protein
MLVMPKLGDQMLDFAQPVSRQRRSTSTRRFEISQLVCCIKYFAFTCIKALFVELRLEMLAALFWMPKPQLARG